MVLHSFCSAISSSPASIFSIFRGFIDIFFATLCAGSIFFLGNLVFSLLGFLSLLVDIVLELNFRCKCFTALLLIWLFDPLDFHLFKRGHLWTSADQVSAFSESSWDLSFFCCYLFDKRLLRQFLLRTDLREKEVSYSCCI